MSHVVIGSGPAGVAAAHALTEAGHAVLVLDAGDRIEAGERDVFDELAQSDPEDWSPELARSARGAFPVTAKSAPLKPAYGSLFPYALEDGDLPVVSDNTETLPSLALGGLSNSWGASMLPVCGRDIEDWPIGLEELAPHYEAVLRFVPLAGERDRLSALLPLYTDTPGSLQRGPQAEMALEHMRRHATALKQEGFIFGASRLAVDASTCRYSGMCLYGCPYRSIYNAADTLAGLVGKGSVEYRGGVYVDRLSSVDGGVRIDLHERGRVAATSQLMASRVFVACGAVSSTRLMLESIGRADHAARLLDSQYFVIPMLRRRGAPVSVRTQGNTLAQAFLELEDRTVSEHIVHLQLYGYNDLMLSMLAARLPLSADRLERGLQFALGRLMVIQGYLHSSDSQGMAVTLSSSGVRLVGEDQAEGRMRIRRLVRRLAANARLLGMMPLPGLAQVGLPGKGNHLGGSFPMRCEPTGRETDILGRLPSHERIHLVDASVFPSVPATTVTLSVMANAHRIASAVARMGD